MRHIQYPDDLESKFKFVTVASLRCMQLQKGAKQRVTSRSRKYATVAQEEVLAGFVREMTEEEIKAAAEAAMAPAPEEPKAEVAQATE
ncbi:MAG: DNA-directed RNA polymerase subunit omega [Acidobacteria bacterium]|nr:DNA-directed RNA polymerase subunit omega [Acidobacteriota bacterium]